MNDLTISCPNCNTVIPLSEAVTRPIRERVTQDFEADRKVQERLLAEREQKLREAQAALVQARSTFDEQVDKKVTEEKAGLLATVRRQVEEKLSVEMNDLYARLEEQKLQLKQAHAAELEWRRKQRELEEQKQRLELDVARKLNEERGKIADQVRAHVSEEQRLRLAEKEKLIGDLQQQINLLKQKSEQGCVQLQGEVLELDLEDRLRAMFVSDSVEPVAKGQRGADILHRVRTNVGLECGTILWETKRTKAFGRDWITKLKEDQRLARADLAVIVTQTMPAELKSFGLVDGIWVCEFVCALPLAAALRHGLVSMGVARQAETGKRCAKRDAGIHIIELSRNR